MMASEKIVDRALANCRTGFLTLLLFSLGINLLMLTTPLYMLQIFDRVVTSRSTDTLLLLSLIAIAALVTLAGLETVRSYVLIRIGTWLDQRLSAPTLAGSLARALHGVAPSSIQGLRDLATLRSFLAGPGILPLLDAPWSPIFIAVIFLLHPLLGWIALGGAAVLLAAAIVTELLTRQPQRQAGTSAIQALQQAQAALRNAEVIAAMGMQPHLLRRWDRDNQETLERQTCASQRSAVMSALAKSGRLALQIGILGMGAWLVIRNELTPGAMIASSILMSRALAPVDQAIGFCRAMTSARNSYRRLRRDLEVGSVTTSGMTLPAPLGKVAVEAVSYKHPCAQEAAIRGVSFELEPGEVLGLVGPTAAGKSTLARLLIGNVAPQSGHVRLDGVDVAAWCPEDRGPYLGYLPQDVELFGGTIKENIARLAEPDSASVIEAAQLAGVHDMILRLPNGYDTEVGELGTTLSGGQRQRIALARAVYGSPRFIVLDEPNASLDGDGEVALLATIEALKQRAVTIVIIAHRPHVLRIVDKILVVQAGSVGLCGARDDVLQQIAGPQTRATAVEQTAP